MADRFLRAPALELANANPMQIGATFLPAPIGPSDTLSHWMAPC